jgi:hypothetical protein
VSRVDAVGVVGGDVLPDDESEGEERKVLDDAEGGGVSGETWRWRPGPIDLWKMRVKLRQKLWNILVQGSKGI